ncbi:nucleoside hydrolase [Nonomuraea sp. KC401]|uniref:Nucleoside hydrolase n=1 Tax=Nonomuraea longispora TaxID=1848320 RepID=A0A4R4NBX4_9ACTN|nr:MULTISPECIES: nucleoside hydrolase [Nonomuraea]NBE92723.1 nucleoside hydrolase [Nonomuraea sp. K271]TDC06379.1 nucleoside hydrolase [Nonomuraea longispora]TLF60492.1 nucleoside hydrolase [Nonomuraea sp. KC401]
MKDLILDVDTGVDDALALLFAVRHPELRLRAVTCVAGNAGLGQVVANTLKVLDAAGAPDVPVSAGAERPLIEPARDAGHIHGADGLADLGLPVSARRPAGVPAVDLLRDTILGAPEPVVVVGLAPLTNLALLLRACPEVAGNIERLVLMGGSASIGNATPVAEFNVWHDPEAAAIVMDAGVPVTMYGLDVFYHVSVDAPTCAELLGHDEPGSRLAGLLLRHQIALCGADPRVNGDGLLGDAGAVCAVADPGGLTTERLPVSVELAPGRSRGQTLVDRRVLPGEDAAHGLAGTANGVDVALAVDALRYRKLFLDTLLSGPPA